MVDRWLHRIEARSRGAVIIGSLVFLLLLGGVDFVLAGGLELRPFYLLPIAAVTWRTGLRAGPGIAAAAAAAVNAGRAEAGVLLWAGSFLLDLLLFAAVVGLVFALKRTRSSGQQLRVTDPLTGLSTSDAFYEAAGRQVKMAVRYRRPLTLAYIGVDNFAALNTRFGHQTGDDVLVSIAQTLRQTVRETDLVARMAGDEFGIVFPETDSAAGRTVAAKVRAQLVEATDGWPITFSIGVVTCERTSCTLDELIRRAEGLMREVKAAGRDDLRVEVMEPGPLEPSRAPEVEPAGAHRERPS